MRAKLAAFSVLLVALGSSFAAATLGLWNGDASPAGWSVLAAGLFFAAIGAVIIGRRPERVMGWIFSAAGLLWCAGALSDEYATYTYVTNPGSLPGGVVALWFGEWYWLAFINVAFVLTLFLFPTGRLPSGRWRIVFWPSVGSAIILTAFAMLERELQLAGHRVTVLNPIGLLPVDDVETGALGSVLLVLTLLSALGALSCLIVRFRRSQGDERQQLKWFTYAGALVIVGWSALGVLDATGLRFDFGYAVLLYLLPAAAGIALLKYRLYDIDRVINKTLVYGAVTTILLLGYGGGVLLVQAVLPIPDDSPAAVAASTLAMAALFGPLRARVQVLVDRRFYRAHYDAEQALSRFSGDLRNETNLESLTTNLLDVVSDTVQPAHVSVWLLPAAAGSRRS
jgi:uncharacterized membrane protein YfcA